jgi:hypothetical protein
MTDDSPPLVPNEKKFSSWLDNESDNSNDFFSVLKKTVEKNVYLDEDINNKKTCSNQFNERSTVRVDSSDLISRCKQFLPLLTDANRNLFSKIKSGENVRMELDSDEEEEEERTIEMNLMFCPNINSSSSSESEDEIQINKKINPVQIIEIQSTKGSEENVNN